MNGKKIELRPCPFCGRNATIIKNECEETGFIGYFVFHSCGLMEGIRTKLEDTPERAAYDWNRRVDNGLSGSD